jgi:hypothetical protein
VTDSKQTVDLTRNSFSFIPIHIFRYILISTDDIEKMSEVQLLRELSSSFLHWSNLASTIHEELTTWSRLSLWLGIWSVDTEGQTEKLCKMLINDQLV